MFGVNKHVAGRAAEVADAKRAAGKSGFIPFAIPDIGEEEIAEVASAMRSGWITTGPRTRQFEQEFAAFIGGGVQAIAVNSATSGLHLAIEAAGVRPGDRVITTPYTFTATAEVVRYLGADPVFIDIDPATLNMDPVRVKKYLAKKNQAKGIKAIIPVHFGGLPCEMDEILRIAGNHGLKVIEDAAHAVPALYGNNLVGCLGSDAAVYSFYATKTMTTGEGGMIVTRDPAIAGRCRTMRLHGISRDAFDRYRAETPSWQYEVVAPGFKYNMGDLAAAIGIHQLRKVWRFHRIRSKMAARYNEAFGDLPVILPPRANFGDVHAWHLYVIRLADDAGVRRDRFIELMAEKGIGCSVHFIPLHLHPYWRQRYDLKPGDFPNALRAYERAVSLPMYTRMTPSDQEKVITAVRDILK
ncbi:MAG: DegT/DnrJ/EryC1/StrS family aminotransferase [Nitrospiraceae bacterium]|nr:DegT/DnrJ/EryC1/StrS family aminotransferase [Nitrospiraceae bacterium]